MKKALSIVLVLAMIFSFSTIAFAREVTSGVYFGPKANIEANPGEEASFILEFKSALTEDELAEIGCDKDGTLAIPFNVLASDADLIPIKGCELTEAAKKAGAKLEIMNNDDEGLTDDADDLVWLFGEVTIPASYLFSGEALDVLKFTVTVSADWEVIDYQATYEPYIECTVGDGADWINGFPVRVISADGEEVPYYGVTTDAGSISAKPYQPSFFERVWEWIKAKVRGIIALDNTINGLLEQFVFPKAEWYDDYLARKDAAKNVQA